MKTKRIVALALAGALALGAVTPAFAEEGKKAESIAKKYNTTEEYTKVSQAQRMTVEKLQKEEAELKAKSEEKAEVDKQAKLKVMDAEKTVSDVEEAIQKKAVEIVAKKKEQTTNENNIGALKRKLVEIPNNPDGDFLDSSDAYSKKIAQLKSKITLTAEEKEKALKDALAEKQKTDKSATKLDDKEEANALKKALVVKQNDDPVVKAVTTAKSYYEKGWRQGKDKLDSFVELTKNAQDLVHDLEVLEQEKEKLENTLKLDKHLLDNAKAAAATANLEYGKAKKAYEDKIQERIAQENILDDLQKIGQTLTVEQVEGVTNPAIVELGQKDKTAFIVFYLLTHQNHKISAETLKQLGLDESILKSYNDLLGDETDPKPGKSEESSQEEESKKPDESKPNEEKPDASEDKPAPIVPGKEDKPATDKKDNKKDNKKATKKSNKAPKTGDIAVLAYAGTAVLAAGAYVASKKRK